ncbi:MAG: isoprenylcysteine carboxylmethyltransferase family protein [Alphaproteobacteria bacterium]
MNGAVLVLLVIALVCEAGLAAMLAWSIAMPERRLWPPRRVTLVSQFLIWPPTVVIFVSAFLLGLADWNRFDWPATLRWGVGLPLVVAGNIIVWRAVFGIGIEATSGAIDHLKTDGLYRWSRNPQYVADMMILVGWVILSASGWALPVVLGGVGVLALAPFAEEPWLRRTYGDPYDAYKHRTARYLGWPER